MLLKSVAASMENLVLSAYDDHGVSSCWMTAANQAHMTKDLRDEFAPGHELVGIIALGYNAVEEAPKAPKRKADKFVLI